MKFELEQLLVDFHMAVVPEEDIVVVDRQMGTGCTELEQQTVVVVAVVGIPVVGNPVALAVHMLVAYEPYPAAERIPGPCEQQSHRECGNIQHHHMHSMIHMT